MARMCTETVRLRVYLIYAACGAVVGLSAFIAFLAVYSNYHAAIWGLVSGIFATLVVLILVPHTRFLYQRYRILFYLQIFGLVVAIGSCVAFIVYIILAVVQHQGLDPTSYYVTSVWVFMTAKWAFGLFYFSRSQKRKYEDENQLI
ncbi:heme transporter hrg1-B-like [Ptychodera flava]|uniref:heme transporter hrg1-B-like n=1 Tax=Ptychodera flava TaxID=63121 RepID=UPI00396A3298